MDSKLEGLIQQKKIPLRGSSSLKRFPEDEQLYLMEQILPRVHLTTNQIIRLAEWLSDLKKLQKTTLEKVLSAPPVQAILSHSGLEARLRGEKFFEAVRSLRFPHVTRFLRAQRPSSESLL